MIGWLNVALPETKLIQKGAVMVELFGKDKGDYFFQSFERILVYLVWMRASEKVEQLGEIRVEELAMDLVELYPCEVDLLLA